MRVDLCSTYDCECVALPGARARYFGADQPRLVAEVGLPWNALGVTDAPRSVRLAVGVTGFHRGRWMSTGGRPPAATIRDTARWPRQTLAPPPG
jgi:hypothetical protein